MVSDLSLLSIDREENPVDILLDQMLTPTDVRIINVVARFSYEKRRIPTASDIQEKLSKLNQLKKTQLYERLNRLARLGFLSVRLLPKPRRYLANRNTITQGVEKWVEEQRASIASLSSELEALQDSLKRMNTKSFASEITDKLSMNLSSA